VHDHEKRYRGIGEIVPLGGELYLPRLVLGQFVPECTTIPEPRQSASTATCCRRLRSSAPIGYVSDARFPWADAHGYLLAPPTRLSGKPAQDAFLQVRNAIALPCASRGLTGICCRRCRGSTGIPGLPLGALSRHI